MSYKVAIRKDYYGKLKVDKDGNEVFEKCGRAVMINRVLNMIESNKIVLELKFKYGFKERTCKVLRGEISDYNNVKRLADEGIDVDRKSAEVLYKCIMEQEEDFLNNESPVITYNGLGWIKTDSIEYDGKLRWYYRASKIISDESFNDGVIYGMYLGNFKIDTMGTYKAWREMVEEHVLPHTPLSIVLLCALSSVTGALLAERYPIGNGILHLAGVSSSGKSTSAYLAASISGQPTTCAKSETDADGNANVKSSLLQSFSATGNALIGRLSGCCGVPIILDELGKYDGKDMTSLVYNLFDGNGKARMNRELKVSEQEGFLGTVITIGEFSIFEKCKSKAEGLHNRVFEVKDRLTVSAKHSDIIKNVCTDNNGRAAPRLARHILLSGGIGYVESKYNQWKAMLMQVLPKVHFKEKFISTFAALYLATAEIAQEALELKFDTDAIIKYFINYLKTNTMNVSETSYAYLMEQFAVNSKKFYDFESSNTIYGNSEIWGRYVNKKKVNADGRVVAGEYVVRQNVVNRLLKEGGFTKTQCVACWKEHNEIDYEKGHNTRSRIVEFGKPAEDVFVFYNFEHKEDNNHNE